MVQVRGRMKIAIIGSGISGLTCAWLLRKRHQVQVFEAGNYVGGHTHTVDFALDGRGYSVDTGFIVCNDRTYPNFLRLLDHLGVARRPSEMSFSVRCDMTGLEYSGSGLNGLFVQRRNLLRPAFLKMVADILRFNKKGTRDAGTVSQSTTVGEYIEEHGYGSHFEQHYLLPMGAAIWSCPTGTFRDFPIRFILDFYHHHGLLSLTNRPQWYVIEGGSKQYIKALTAGFEDQIHLNCAASSINRSKDGVTVCSPRGTEQFDEVIFACHSDQALALLNMPTSEELEILKAFPYSANDAVLHTDKSVLPRRKAAWSSWNYRIRPDLNNRPTVTYNMNILQGINSPHTFCVSLNDVDQISDEKVIGRYRYSHPVFSIQRSTMQARHRELIRHNRTSFCGAYWGNGFHEDGVVSALHVCRQFGALHILDVELSDMMPSECSSIGPSISAGA